MWSPERSGLDPVVAGAEFFESECSGANHPVVAGAECQSPFLMLSVHCTVIVDFTIKAAIKYCIQLNEELTSGVRHCTASKYELDRSHLKQEHINFKIAAPSRFEMCWVHNGQKCTIYTCDFRTVEESDGD